MRSKAHWGYSSDFLESCRTELTVEPSDIGSESTDHVVAIENGSIVGFYLLEPVAASTYELSALFVEPGRIGHGIGRKLLEHAVATLQNIGAGTLTIQSDPHVTDFYVSAGAQQVGTQESGSIPGRFLPLLEIHIQAL